MHRARLTAIAVSTVAVPLLVSCSAEPEPVPSETASPDPVVTVVVTESPEPSASPEATEPSESATFAWEAEPGAYVIPAVEGNDAGTAGSGCVPGGDTLPDGVWFGYVSSYTAGAISLDLACYYVPGSAEWDAQEAAANDEGIAFAAAITNDNPSEFDVAIAADAFLYDEMTGTWIPWSPDGLDAMDAQYSYDATWVVINDGAVTQYIPLYFP